MEDQDSNSEVLKDVADAESQPEESGKEPEATAEMVEDAVKETPPAERVDKLPPEVEREIRLIVKEEISKALGHSR